ncbi:MULTISPECIES: NUDIX hydrolase [Bacillales]|jgi:8-oxo-dGTP diphosphatase|uniref:NUDIX hydrolase n=1 Tax=Bacillales TaxID=1385 RepID=UPI00188CE709|nr:MULTISPECIES: NUDIX domain-containing protein [Bacillaceae]MED1490746.1 NUDIX domain-containing protein [Bacillus smithii]QPA32548.1 NUDIX domain-containing protein [Anoxybacillus caldiproteolyticus]
MKIIKCSCLVNKKEDKLLCVRVRDNKLWYLPGGKIEHDETPEETLVRELYEELSIRIERSSIKYLCNIIGPAYGEEAMVELYCYTAEWTGEIKPHAEISEVSWIDINHKELLAPAVIELLNHL